MKFVASDAGRILDRVAIEEIRPPGGVFVPDFIRALVERYQFAVLPANMADAIRDGTKFEHGKLPHEGQSVVVKELAIYADGVISEAFDTDLADLILDDFFAWATETFKLRERQQPALRTYTSAVVIEFEKEIEPALGKMAEVCGLLSDALKSSYGWEYTYNASRLTFSVDPLAIPPYRGTTFMLERRVQTPYSENRFYSAASLRTQDHLKLLQAIETNFLS
jgi:hypothetical protein